MIRTFHLVTVQTGLYSVSAIGCRVTRVYRYGREYAVRVQLGEKPAAFFCHRPARNGNRRRPRRPEPDVIHPYRRASRDGRLYLYLTMQHAMDTVTDTNQSPKEPIRHGMVLVTL